MEPGLPRKKQRRRGTAHLSISSALAQAVVSSLIWVLSRSGTTSCRGKRKKPDSSSGVKTLRFEIGAAGFSLCRQCFVPAEHCFLAEHSQPCVDLQRGMDKLETKAR